MVLKKFLFFALILFCTQVYPHPLDTGYMQIKADAEKESIFTSMEIHPALVRSRNYFHETLGRTNWKAGNRRCQWRDSKAIAVNSETLKISARAECPGLHSRDRLSLDLRFLETSRTDVKIFIRAATPDYESTMIVHKNNRFIKMAPTIKAGFFEYTLLGIEALGVSPSTWAEGSLFHIPFGLNQFFLVLLMIAVARNKKDLFQHLGGFTLSLSVALCWVSFRGIIFQTKYIDVLMAFGLLYFSLDIILLKRSFRRNIYSILLGLIHGFKMGEILLGFDLPEALVPKALNGFLTGIVFAQIFVVLFFSPLMNAVRKYSFVRIPLHTATALLAAAIGSLWLFEKASVVFT